MSRIGVSMEELDPGAIDGILFADPFDALDMYPEVRACVAEWRPTFGGKLLATFDGWPPREVRKHLAGRNWQWPVIPVEVVSICGEDDVWITGTVGEFSDAYIQSFVEPEVNHRQSRFDDDGTEIPCISRKLAHRVLWCQRWRKEIISDPLYRVVFTDMEAALAFLERRKMIHGEPDDRCI
jgi:hypothetical protein